MFPQEATVLTCKASEELLCDSMVDDLALPLLVLFELCRRNMSVGLSSHGLKSPFPLPEFVWREMQDALA